MNASGFVPGLEYFCWVRVVSADSLATKAPVFRIKPSRSLVFLWDLRPKGVVDRNPAKDDPRDPTVRHDIGVWAAPKEFFGRDGADTAFDYGPAFLTMDAAAHWIANTEAGKQWDAESLNRFLMSLTQFPTASFSSVVETPDDPATPPPKENLREHEVTFEGQRVTLRAPDKFINPVEECAILINYKAKRTRAIAQINREAINAYQAVDTVLASIGISTDDPVSLAFKEFREKLLARIEPPILDFKALFGRRRPWDTCSQDLQPMLALPDWRHPGHPAYPSGHATVAWAFALTLARALPSFAPLLEAAARRVALNREVAGVHYPSDSMAGEELARKLVDIMYPQGSALVSELQEHLETLGIGA
jgi:PAP2 superfamily